MIRVEMLSSENIDKVWELEKICFKDDPWDKNAFLSELENKISVYFVAVDDENDMVVSYAGLWLMYDSANITNIAVHPRYREEGIGSKMLALLIDISREKNMDNITLEVRKSNIAAIALYKKHGFLEEGIRRHYYKDREDAIIMTKKL